MGVPVKSLNVSARNDGVELSVGVAGVEEVRGSPCLGSGPVLNCEGYTVVFNGVVGFEVEADGFDFLGPDAFEGVGAELTFRRGRADER